MDNWQTLLNRLLIHPTYACRGGTRALATRLGVTRVAVYRWRMGITTPTYHHQEAIRQAQK